MKNTQIKNGRHILQNIDCSGRYKNLKKCKKNGVILRRLNKLNPVFILEKKSVTFW